MKTSFHGLISAIEKSYKWASTTPVHRALETIPKSKIFIEMLIKQRAFAGKVARQYTTLTPEMRDLLEEGFVLDSIYDRKLSGMYAALTALSTTTDDPVLSLSLLETRDTLFPEGVLGKTGSYLRQAGYVVISNMRISLKMRSLISGISYNNCTLLNDFTEWSVIGKRLSVIEKEWEYWTARENISPVYPFELRNLRIQWTQFLDDFKQAITDAQIIDEITRKGLLAGLNSIESVYKPRSLSSIPAPPEESGLHPKSA